MGVVDQTKPALLDSKLEVGAIYFSHGIVLKKSDDLLPLLSCYGFGSHNSLRIIRHKTSHAYRPSSKFVDCACKSHELEIVHMCYAISRLERNLEIVQILRLHGTYT